MFFFKIMKVRGQSMLPYLKENQLVLTSSIPVLFSAIKVGDVIVASDPRNKMKVIKRITKIDGDKYFIQGDNRLFSTDSREFGFIQKESILYKLIIKLSF